jgi:tetratricopeptide (TPR) repeat protein
VVSPDFEADDRELVAITAIAERLDGIPLAIELAASRVRILKPSELLPRLLKHLDALGSGGRDTTERQRTLAGAVAWSWDILGDDERDAMAQLAVFSGGFTLEMAEALLVTSGDSLELVANLSDKSMLRDQSTPGRERRFGFYATIADFAQRRLDERDDATAVMTRHAQVMVALGERLALAVHTQDGERALERLAAERPNLLKSSAYALESGDGEMAIRTTVALDSILSTRGPFARYRALLDDSLMLDVDPPLRARALHCRGNLHRLQGRGDDAIIDLSEARRLGAEAGDKAQEAASVAALGIAQHELGNLAEAETLHDEALGLARQAGDRRTEARALGSLAIMRDEQGRADDAQVLYEQALALFRQIKDRRSIGVFLSNLGDLHYEQGRSREARNHYEQALEIVRDIGDLRVEAVVLGNLGGVHQDLGELDQALTRREEAVNRLRSVGDGRLLGVFQGYRGSVHLERGQLGDALVDLRDAIDRVRAAGDRRYEGLFWCFLAVAQAQLGRPEEARAAFDTGVSLLETVGDPLLVAAASVHRAHEHLAHDPDGAVRALTAAHASEHSNEVEAPTRSGEVRFAIRLLNKALGDRSPVLEAVVPRLVVESEGKTFTPPNGEPVDLSRRRSLRLVLLSLSALRLSSPGQSMSVDEILAAGWPGERVMAEAGANRVYVVVATLRKLGLRELLISRDDGYLLDPETRLDYSA